MKALLILLLTVTCIRCTTSPSVESSEVSAVGPIIAETYEFSSIKELLIYDLIGDPEKKISNPDISYTKVVGYDHEKFIEMNWKEMQNTFTINDTIQISSDLNLIFYSFSVKSDIIRDYSWIRTISDKYFISMPLFYDFSPPQDYPGLSDDEVTNIQDKMEKWEESSSKVWWH